MEKEFIDWLNSDEPFNEKVYGKDILNDKEWVGNVNKARDIINQELKQNISKPEPKIETIEKPVEKVEGKEEGKPLEEIDRDNKYYYRKYKDADGNIWEATSSNKNKKGNYDITVNGEKIETGAAKLSDIEPRIEMEIKARKESNSGFGAL